MKELFRFNYNDYVYKLLLKNNKLIYLKEKDNKIFYDFNEGEFNIFNQLLVRLMPSNKLITLSNIKYNNKVYVNKYDKINNLHLIYNKNNFDLNDLSYLNYKYNNQLGYVNITNHNENKNNNFIKRFVPVIKGSALIILVTEITTLYLALMPYINPRKENVVMHAINDLTYSQRIDSINKNIIIDEINNNGNLTEDEKNYFTSFSNFFENDSKYFDATDLYNNLRKFKIEYINEIDEECSGRWDYINKKIIMYDSTNFNNCDKSTLRHEFFHMFSDTKYLYDSFGEYYYESNNAIINNEYAGYNPNDKEYDTGYFVLNNYTYFINELISNNNEILNLYHSSPKIKLIVDELIKIIPDEDKAYNLLNLLYEYFDAYIDYVEKFNSNENYQKEMNNFFEIKTEIENNLQEYYEAKYNEDVKNNQYMYYLLNQDSFIQDLIINNDIILPREYFGFIKEYKNCYINKEDDYKISFKLNKTINNEEIYFTIPENHKGLYNYFLSKKVNLINQKYDNDHLLEFSELLYNLFDNETINKYIETSDINVLINKLASLNSDKEMAIYLLDTYENYYNFLNSNIDIENQNSELINYNFTLKNNFRIYNELLHNKK